MFMQSKQSTTQEFISSITSRKNICFWIVFLVHFSIAVFYKEIVGINIESDPGRDAWDGLWQTLPAESLKANMVHSVWNLHSQPPLYNLYGAFFIKLFYPHHLQYMHYSNIILGSLLSAILYIILVQLTRDKLLSYTDSFQNRIL